MHLAGFTNTNDVYIPERIKPDSLFEKNYVNLRWMEKRLYNDEEVLHLPIVSADRPHYAEWKIRHQSTLRLVKYLQQKKQTLNILEVGCGNGWLSNRLSMIQHSEVIGIDVNFSELQQAARVFHGSKGLQFMYGDIRAGILDKFKFDVILFSASIQYFPSLKNIVEIAAGLLKTGGEIHIMDSHFYKLSESEAAKKRTKAYYDHLGFPEMATYYFHHSLCELHQYNVKMLSKPSRFSRLLPGIRNPFPWICIKNGSLY